MAIEPHIHEYALIEETLQEKPIMRAFCIHPECDHELDAQGIILGLNASACIDQELAMEMEEVMGSEALASGLDYLKRILMAQRLKRYAASLMRVEVANVVS